jgi:hypothetical protein
MSLYLTALSLHVIGSFGICAALALEWAVILQLKQTREVGSALEWIGIFSGLRWVGGISMAALLLPGFYMVSVAWREAGWVTVALGSVVLLALIGGTISGIRINRLKKLLVATQGGMTPDLLERTRDPLMTISLQVRTAIIAAATALMTFKPNLGNSLLILMGAMIAGLVAGLTLRRTVN